MSIWSPVASKPSNESMVPLAFRSTPRPPADSTTEPLPWITVSVPAGPKPCPTELIDKVEIDIFCTLNRRHSGPRWNRGDKAARSFEILRTEFAKRHFIDGTWKNLK